MASVIRRVYGRKAVVRVSADRNSPNYGMVVRWVPAAAAWSVGATIYCWVEDASSAASADGQPMGGLS